MFVKGAQEEEKKLWRPYTLEMQVSESLEHQLRHIGRLIAGEIFANERLQAAPSWSIESNITFCCGERSQVLLVSTAVHYASSPLAVVKTTQV